MLKSINFDLCWGNFYQGFDGLVSRCSCYGPYSIAHPAKLVTIVPNFFSEPHYDLHYFFLFKTELQEVFRKSSHCPLLVYLFRRLTKSVENCVKKIWERNKKGRKNNELISFALLLFFFISLNDPILCKNLI